MPQDHDGPGAQAFSQVSYPEIEDDRVIRKDGWPADVAHRLAMPSGEAGRLATAPSDAKSKPPCAGGAPPRVSVLIAAYNAGKFIVPALRSVLGQTLRDLEAIVADDGSTDDTVARVAAIAATDPRVRLLESAGRGGPGAARNRCIEAARGAWLAIFDSDDLMHPERLERLLMHAERDGADIAADDLMIFDDTAMTPPVTCLPGGTRPDVGGPGVGWIDAPTYVARNDIFGRGWALGYLKPLVRASTLHASGVRYDPDLRIGEDYDFIVRLLAYHARFRIYPVPTYFYRRHGASISHRLSPPVVQALLDANSRFRAAAQAAAGSPLDTALATRERMLTRALIFENFVAALKARDLRGAIAQARRDPGVVLLLHGAIRQRLRRLWRRLVETCSLKPPAMKPPDGGICVLSRQRIVGNANGSSTYLLSLCDALHRDGHTLHLLCPSPTVYGRWPALVMGREMSVFRSIRIRGSLRIGNVYFATDPTILRRAFVGILGKVFTRLGIDVPALSKPAPYSIGLPWQTADLRYVAQHAPRHADGILADYTFLTEGIPYVLGAEGPSAVVMHDLFSSRPAQFGPLGAEDTVGLLDEDTEMAMLGRADAVIAIQEEEAAKVRRRLPGTRVLLAPMATTPVAAPQPADGFDILFIGSNTSPNVDGLRWFFDEIWPAVRRVHPAARLNVAGNVAASFRAIPEGVTMLGRVNDLVPLYAAAAVVISPLRAGSGLKIKLIEALGHGKAIVATSTTLQGVTEIVGPAVVVADDAPTFAGAIATLLSNKALRARLGDSALGVVRQNFSAAVCYASVVEFFAGADAPPVQASVPAAVIRPHNAVGSVR